MYGAFKFAFLKKLISVNPTKLIQKIKEDKIIIAEDGSEKIKQKKLARYNVYTQQELDIIFQKFHNTQWEVVCKLVYYAFIRFSEIFRLKLEHLDLENGYINIPAIIAKGQREGELLTIKLFPNVLEALKRYLEYTFEKD